MKFFPSRRGAVEPAEAPAPEPAAPAAEATPLAVPAPVVEPAVPAAEAAPVAAPDPLTATTWDWHHEPALACEQIAAEMGIDWRSGEPLERTSVDVLSGRPADVWTASPEPEALFCQGLREAI